MFCASTVEFKGVAVPSMLTRPTSINESDPAAAASIPLDIDYLPSPALPCEDLSAAVGNEPVAGEYLASIVFDPDCSPVFENPSRLIPFDVVIIFLL